MIIRSLRSASVLAQFAPCSPRLCATLLGALLIAGFLPAARGQAKVLDDFDSLEPWRVIASDGVTGTISPADGVAGRALRLDFDFHSGAGFCVIRRQISLPLPKNYRFSFALRGAAQPNNLEFKLVDTSGDNVWWSVRRDFDFPTDWQTLSYKARHFSFAWGPSGGKPLDTIGAIELAISASGGGQGHVLIDRLMFEALPPPPPAAGPALVQVSSARWQDQPTPLPLDASGRLSWASKDGDQQPWLRVEFEQLRDFGGLALEWDKDDYATAYDISLSQDGVHWAKVASIDDSSGGRDYLPLANAETRQVRLDVRATSRGRGIGVRSLHIMEPEFGDSQNSVYNMMVRDAPRGWFPRYFLGEQPYWTVVGAAGDEREALLDTDGALEVDKRGFRLEPFLLIDGRLVSWADTSTRQSLADDYLPIPTVSWQVGDGTLEITALADGTAGNSTLLARYRLINSGAQPWKGTLFLAIRPFQVLPPWQQLNVGGGTTKLESLRRDRRRLVVNDAKVIDLWTDPVGFGATTFAQGDIAEFVSAGRLPTAQSVRDPAGLASGALRYDFDLAPQAETAVVVAVPFHKASADAGPELAADAAAARFTNALARARETWSREVNRVTLTLPPEAARLVNTFRTTQAYILINADGPAIQPGSRTYERSWMRDGALTSTALLCTGHPEQVRAFLDWYSGFQFPGGKVPCVVDRRGPDPVPEHDSTGELIYALWTYYQFTHDRAWLAQHLPQVIAGVDYIEALRKERLTDAYRDGPPEMRACYGLVPESISHEGYSAKPMHSYWDSFFVLRGLKDATSIARVLDRPDLEQRFGALRDEYQAALYDSLRLAMQLKHIDYIPGCVELGDFDATSTAIALFPCGEAERLPQPALTDTFARYYDFVRDRRDGKLAWENYTPYEIRVVGTFLRLGQPERAHEALDFFFQGQRPAAWNEWAEVVWRDPATPKFIGDMPHTWVGSEFINAVRSMFVCERESDDALVLAAGVRPEWAAAPGGVAIADFPTPYGKISYTLQTDGPRMVVQLQGAGEVPPGGLVLCVPGDHPIQSVEFDGRPWDGFKAHDVTLKALRGEVVITLPP